MRKLTVYIAASLDGYIAKPGDDLSFLDCVGDAGEDYGYADFVAGVDTVLMGRKTYDWLVQHTDVFPHSDRETFVITRSPKAPSGNISFYAGDVAQLVNGLKARPGKNIFCDGGAQIVNELLRLGLVDELTVSVIPVLLGSGTRLFSHSIPEQYLQLISCRSYRSGLCQMQYRTIPNK